MKVITTGSLGQIGLPVTQKLLAEGHHVTAITHRSENQPALEGLGARALVGSVEDPAFLERALQGADAIFALLPPSYTTTDYPAYARTIGAHWARAIGRSGAARVIVLSSWGADLDHGTGFIVGTHYLERALSGVAPAVTNLRATSLYNNLFSFIAQIKGGGTITANYGEETRMALVHTTDIADAVAEELRSPLVHRKTRYVASDLVSMGDVATALGEALGTAPLGWTVVSDQALRAGLVQYGLSDYTAGLVVELGAAHRDGLLMDDFERHKPGTGGRVKLAEFAREWARAFRGSS